MNLNRAILVGRLTKDPEARVLPSGQQLTSFGLATSRFYKDQSGQRQEKTEFHNIVIFGKMAETASLYLKKGSLALIEGRIQTRNWLDATGNKRYRTEIVAEGLQLGPRPQGQQNQTAPLSSGYSQAMPPEQTAPQTQQAQPTQQDAEPEIPIIEENDTIDVKNIPF
jgi:single-strand DNA-binding protein